MSSFKNVMIVLGELPRPDGRPSDRMVARVRKAISLYKKNNYGRIILSGGPTRGIPEAEMMRIMMAIYIPKNKILLEPRSMDTAQNAVFCWELIKDKKPKHITIVTTEYHMPRASYIFKRLYSHMGVRLKFESAVEPLDPIESFFRKVKEFLSLLRLKIFGFGIK